MTLSRRGLLRAKRLALRRKIALFGEGPRSLFDFGPNAGISCSSTANRCSLAGAAGRLRAQLSDPSEYENVRLGSTFTPPT